MILEESVTGESMGEAVDESECDEEGGHGDEFANRPNGKPRGAVVQQVDVLEKKKRVQIVDHRPQSLGPHRLLCGGLGEEAAPCRLRFEVTTTTSTQLGLGP
mmetsp:Transcript_13315/g.42086  ORF Transcript_13315/g.42086 Transcript_13315/m.42086 type:complete len:102 (-) Transcript_13315:140-445(-)